MFTYFKAYAAKAEELWNIKKGQPTENVAALNLFNYRYALRLLIIE